MCQSYCGCKTLFPLSHLLSCFVFCLDLRGEVWEDILFRTEYSKVPHSLHNIRLWISMLILSSVFLMRAESVTHLWIEQYVIRSHHKAMFPQQNISSRFSIDPFILKILLPLAVSCMDSISWRVCKTHFLKSGYCYYRIYTTIVPYFTDCSLCRSHSL